MKDFDNKTIKWLIAESDRVLDHLESTIYENSNDEEISKEIIQATDHLVELQRKLMTETRYLTDLVTEIENHIDRLGDWLGDDDTTEDWKEKND